MGALPARDGGSGTLPWIGCGSGRARRPHSRRGKPGGRPTQFNPPVYRFTPGGTVSESLAGQMQGALAQERQAPFQAGAAPQMAGRRTRPQGAPRKHHDCVAALDKGNNHCLRTAPCPSAFGGL